MKYTTPFLVFIGILVLGLTIGSDFLQHNVSVEAQSVRICTITQRSVQIGHQESIAVLEAGARQWAVIQQPLNATNTVSLWFGATTTQAFDKGYMLTRATTTEGYPVELHLGHATEFPASQIVTARTQSATTSVNIVECK